ENPMRIRHTPADPTRTAAEAGRPPTFVNQLSHWWDGSALYGSDRASEGRVRAFEGGRLRVEGGRLPTDPATGVAITGFNDNWWVGLGLMHPLFALEHNAICARLQRAYPTWSDDRLFETARLINAALMAKIHTVEWTPAVLAHPALRIAMNANWWGLFGERLLRILGRLGRGEVLGGIPGSPTDHHGGALRADRGVRRGLPHAPAHPGHLRAVRAVQRRSAEDPGLRGARRAQRRGRDRRSPRRRGRAVLVRHRPSRRHRAAQLPPGAVRLH